MRNYILGVDGGGTKTHCALFRADGALVELFHWGTTSHEFMQGGYEQLRQELKKLLETIRSAHNLDWGEVEAVFGMAGVDCNTQQEKISGFIAECGLTHFYLCNDSFLGIKAGSPKKWGICTLNGSGTGACGIDPQGNQCRCGSLFELTGDYAGGRILGSEVVRCVYDMLFRGGRQTHMAQLLLACMDARDRDDLMEKVISGVSDRTLEPKSFAPILFEAACMGDECALEILTNCGKQNARDICAVLDELEFPKEEAIPVVMLGSLYTKGKNERIIESLAENLCGTKAEAGFEFIKLKEPPVLGAVIWAMERAGCEYDKEEIARQLRACCD